MSTGTQRCAAIAKLLDCRPTPEERAEALSRMEEER